MTTTDLVRDRRSLTAVLAVLTLTVGVVAGVLMGQRTQAEAEQRFELAVDEAVTTIRLQLDRIEGRARALTTLREQTSDLAGWSDVVARTTPTEPPPGVYSTNVYRVLRAPTAADVAALRDELVAATGTPVDMRVGDGPEAVVIERVAPIGPNLSAIGFDVMLNPGTVVGVRRSLDARAPSIGDAIRLVQAPERGHSFVLVVEPTVSGDGGERIGAVVVDGQDFLEGVEPLLGRVSLHVVDDTGDGPVTLAVSDDHDRDARLTTVRDLEVYGNTWRVEFASVVAPTTAELLSGPLTGIGATLVLGLFSFVVVQALRSRTTAELMVERRTAELTEANEALRTAMQAKDDFVSVVSHELRTPLTVIRGFAATLRDGAGRLDRAGRDLALDRIERNAARLTVLVEDLLATSRLQAGVERARRVVVDVGAELHEAVGDLDVAVDVDAPGGLRALVDPAHLRRIVENLLTNATVYGAPPVVLRCLAEGDSVVVEVRDHGEGIPPELRRRVFERFEQGDRGTTREGHGAGLGLAIVRGLCELNGASVTLTDAEPGACFRVRLVGAPEDVRDETGTDRGRASVADPLEGRRGPRG